jgi:hypothetical protein
MSMEINSHIIKLSGSAELDRQLDLGKEYKFFGTGAVSDINHSSNEDGTFDQVHKLKLLTLAIESEGELIPAKDKGRQSQKLRKAIYSIPHADSYDEEAWYNYIMGGIRFNLQEIVDLIIKNDINE